MPEMAQRESLSSTVQRSNSPAAAADDEERDPHIPSSIPPWVHIASSNDSALVPPPVRPNTRHYKPPPQHYKPGRKWDHLREAEPPLLSSPIAASQTRWEPFMSSGPNPPDFNEEGARLMSPEWMEENVPITVRGWEEEDEILADQSEKPTGWWLLSPERQERTVRLFWVSECGHCSGFATWRRLDERGPGYGHNIRGRRTSMLLPHVRCRFDPVPGPGVNATMYWKWRSFR